MPSERTGREARASPKEGKEPTGGFWAKHPLYAPPPMISRSLFTSIPARINFASIGPEISPTSGMKERS